jgi:cytochrome P450
MTATVDSGELSAKLLLDPSVIDDPYDFYGQLRDEAPVWRIPGSEIVTVSSFEAVSEAAGRVHDFSSNLRGVVFRNDVGEPEVFPFDGGPGTDVLATADPPIHTLHRSVVFPELVARRMAELRPDVEALGHGYVDRAVATSRVEAMEAIANAVPIRVVSRLIGWQDEDPDRLLAAAFDSTAVVRATASCDELVESMVRSAEIMEWITGQLDNAVANGAEGILGAIAAAIGTGDLEHIAGIVIMHTLLSAGGESTTSLIGNAIHLLATDPDLQARVRADPALVTPFIEEVLRLESPFRYHLRHVPDDCELHGVTVPAGSTALLMWAAANRDPAEFDRPDAVVLDRPSARHHLGFGRGIHLCVGAPLARLEADVVLTRLLERTEAFSLDAENPPVRENSLMVRRFRRLPLVMTPASRKSTYL